jgi:hypothetical protein
MGYIQQSDTKKIYAYLTQEGKNKIITGDTIDFQIKYFTLHDDDVNYNVSSKLNLTTYNTLKSGFIPDVTGDNNNCLANVIDADRLEKNKLVGIIVPPTPQPPNPTQITATIVGTCSTNGETFEINVTNVKGGTGQGYKWYVKTEVISFTSPTQATVLSTTTSDEYDINIPKSFKATFKFSDTYLPREADSYNFTVYLLDSSGTEVELQKFTDINCSLKKYGWVVNSEVVSNYTPPNLITETNINDLSGTDYYPSFEKYALGIFVIDNGNRRKDLNITDADIPILNSGSYNMLLEFQFKDNCLGQTIDTGGGTITVRPFNPREVNVKPLGLISETIITDEQFSSSSDGLTFWLDILYNSIPASVRASSSYQAYNGKFSILHPTVKSTIPFKIAYVEVIDRIDNNSISFTPPFQYGNRSAYFKPRSENSNVFKFTPSDIIGTNFSTDNLAFTWLTITNC